MRVKFRLIPAVIAAALLLLGIKVADLWLALDARAATPKEEAQAPAEAPPPAPVLAERTPPAAVLSGPRPATKPGSEAEAQDPLLMSPAEIDLLQKLSERRAALDRRAADLAQQEVLLKAAEKRIDEKIAKLQSLEQDIGGIADKQEEAESQRIKSLVKIYETMKPREAARIFEQLDMTVLLDVLERMKELKASPILASMDPAKARQITLALAERRQQHGGPAPAAPPEAPTKP